MKRIAIVGTHGVGKTTLANFLVEIGLQNYNVALNSQLARKLIQAGYPLGKNATSESYIQYIIAQLQAEQSVKSADYFISDRTLLDPLAYATVNHDLLGSTVPESIIKMLNYIWLLELQQYDLYVFVPIEFQMQMDGIRPDGEEYRIEVENRMLHFLEMNKVNFIRVSGTVEARGFQACTAIYSLET